MQQGLGSKITTQTVYGCALVLVLLVPFFAAKAQPLRVALVIGNGAYRAVPALRNPPNDARAIAAMLGGLGFETELLLDAEQTDMQAAIRRLRERSSRAEAAVLFYAGHATEIDGRNFLLPVNTVADRDAIQRRSLDFRVVMHTLSGTSSSTLIILDACRHNPFAATSMQGGVRRTDRSSSSSRSIG